MRKVVALALYLAACRSDQYRTSPAEFAGRVHEYCLTLRCTVVAWQRTAEVNRKLGDEPNSPHLVGLAADVVYDSPIAAIHASRVAARFRLRVVHEQDHDHLEPIESEN